MWGYTHTKQDPNTMAAAAAAAAAPTTALPPGVKAAIKKAALETKTESHILDAVKRQNEIAARDEDAPLAEALTEVFETPDEVWPVARVRTVVLSLRRDYLRMIKPYLHEEDKTFAADTPTDDELRARLVASSATYATLARSNQYKHWFEFFARRELTPQEKTDALSMMELRVAVEEGKITEADALAHLSKTRAGVLQKARALEHLDELKAAGKAPTKAQVRATKAAIAAAKAADEPRRGSGKRGIPPAVLAKLRARCAAEDGDGDGKS